MGSASQAASTDDRPRLYANSAEWLEGYLLPMWRRGPEAGWCRKWWLHGETNSRIEALWLAWEALRYEGPLGIATWFLNYADPMMREPTSPSGMFRHCPPQDRRTRRAAMWTVEPPPPGIFD